jgi:hypothetical protein
LTRIIGSSVGRFVRIVLRRLGSFSVNDAVNRHAGPLATPSEVERQMRLAAEILAEDWEILRQLSR